MQKPAKYVQIVYLISHTGQYDVAIPNTSNDNDEEVGQKKGQVRRKVHSNNNFHSLFVCLKTHSHLLLMIKALNLFISSSLIFLMPLTLKVNIFFDILTFICLFITFQ